MNQPNQTPPVKELNEVAPAKADKNEKKDWGVDEAEAVTVSQTKLAAVLVVCLLGVFGYLFYEKVQERQLANQKDAETLDQIADNEPVNEQGSANSELTFDSTENTEPPQNTFEQNAGSPFDAGQTTLTSLEQAEPRQEDFFAQNDPKNEVVKAQVETIDSSQTAATEDPFLADFGNQGEPKQSGTYNQAATEEEAVNPWAQASVEQNADVVAAQEAFDPQDVFLPEQAQADPQQNITAQNFAEQNFAEQNAFGQTALHNQTVTAKEELPAFPHEFENGNTGDAAFSAQQHVVIQKKADPQQTVIQKKPEEEIVDPFWGETSANDAQTTVVQANPQESHQPPLEVPAEFNFASSESEAKPMNVQQNHQHPQFNAEHQQFGQLFPEENSTAQQTTTVVVENSTQTTVQEQNTAHDPFAQFSSQQQPMTTITQKTAEATKPQPAFNAFEQSQAQQNTPASDPFANHQSLPVDYSQQASQQSPSFETPQYNRVQQVGHQEKISVYRVQPGDNYWRISRKVYGTAKYFSALTEYNKVRIPDPKKLRPGMNVMIPNEKVLERKYPKLFKQMGVTIAGANGQPKKDLPAGFFYSRNGKPMYRVGSEDTLTSIAQKHLGRSSRWIQIYEANRHTLKTPNRLKIGTVIALPADASRISFAPESSLR